jgi:hypothetical protein
VRRTLWTIFGLWLCGLPLGARADTFPLADGTSLTGSIVKSTDTGLMLHTPGDTYTNVLWTKFSQDGLRQLARFPKIAPLVEPFIEIPRSERPKKPEVKVQEVTRLELPAKQSLLGALTTSSVGLVALLLVYAANLYAGFEIAVFRNRPKALVLGVAAVLPVLGPIIFLSMPTHVEPEPVEELVESEPVTFAVPGQEPAQEEIQIAAGSWQTPAAAQAAGQIFKRGQFTFNRRFIETKFAGFFSEPRSGAEAGQLLLVRTAGGELAVERITRIDASTVHLEIAAGGGRREVMVPFTDIQEIQLKPGHA